MSSRSHIRSPTDLRSNSPSSTKRSRRLLLPLHIQRAKDDRTSHTTSTRLISHYWVHSPCVHCVRRATVPNLDFFDVGEKPWVFPNGAGRVGHSVGLDLKACCTGLKKRPLLAELFETRHRSAPSREISSYRRSKLAYVASVHQ